MVAALAAALFEREVGSGPLAEPQYTNNRAVALRIVTTVCAFISVFADCLALVWFIQMKRKFRHSLIMTLILADLVKDLNWIVFSIVTFVRGTVSSKSPYCQVSGFLGQAAIEATDLSVLMLVIHMSLQVLNPAFAAALLDRFRKSIIAMIGFLALLMSSLAYVNTNEGYVLAGAFCVLPVRPLWYRLALGWIERYLIAITIVALTIVIRIKVKGFQQTLARLQHHEIAAMPGHGGMMEENMIPESDEKDSGLGQEDSTDKEKTEDHLFCANNIEKRVPDELDIVPDDEYGQFKADDLQRFKPQAYRMKRNTVNFDGQPRVVSMAASAAPSSAIFSPYRDSFRVSDVPVLRQNDVEAIRSASAVDMPARRQSVAAFGQPMRGMSVMELPAQRRKSLIDSSSAALGGPTTRSSMYQGGDRSSMLLPFPMNAGNGNHRRSSIWDEIDASLDKKFANNRVSMLSLTPSQTDLSNIIRPSSGVVPTTPIYGSTNPKRNSFLNPLSHNRHLNALPSSAPGASDHNTLAPLNISLANSAPASANGPLTGSSTLLQSPTSAVFSPNRPLIAGDLNGNTKHPNASSSVMDRARRTLSIISLRGGNLHNGGAGDGSNGPATPDSPAAILERRHRYIQRQMRYLILYPIVYLTLWTAPFLLHCLQYSDHFARAPPYPLVVLTYVSITMFGFANSLVFCLREKPWTLIPKGDGTVWGSLRPGFIFGGLGKGNVQGPDWIA